MFNTTEHLIQIKSGQTSKDYLPVQWRLVWFRAICPQGTIETKMLHLDLDRETEEEVWAWNAETRRSEKITKHGNGFVIFRASITDGKGGSATATKSEKAASFPDFIEKAETGAIGRALAELGYGTQFTGDALLESQRIVDAPAERQGGDEGSAGAAGAGAQIVPAPGAVQPQKRKSIANLSRLLGKQEPDYEALSAIEAKRLLADLAEAWKLASASKKAGAGAA